MNVFVLCTGRSGSETFTRACSHITNYSAGHETRVPYFGGTRLNYPENHIEADNRLSWFLGSLDKRYGDDAFYVHLVRSKEATAKSYNRRWKHVNGIMRAFAGGILMRDLNKLKAEDKMKISHDYVQVINDNIESFLKDKSKKMILRLEHFKEDYTKFWEAIGAEGNLENALKELEVRHNISGKKNFWRQIGLKR